MSNIIFFSSDLLFTEDMRDQISTYLSEEYKFYTEEEYKPDIIYNLVIIDDQKHVLDYIRDNNKRIPVIYLTSGRKKNIPLIPTDIVLQKPFSLEKLLDILKSCINSFDNIEERAIEFGDYVLCPRHKIIKNNKTGEITKITEKEAEIIKYLHQAKEHNNRIIYRKELLHEVWGYSHDASSHTVETHIYRLRNKVERNGENQQIIITEDGGYKLI